jgi:hypothetical protein
MATILAQKLMLANKSSLLPRKEFSRSGSRFSESVVFP